MDRQDLILMCDRIIGRLDNEISKSNQDENQT